MSQDKPSFIFHAVSLNLICHSGNSGNWHVVATAEDTMTWNLICVRNQHHLAYYSTAASLSPGAGPRALLFSTKGKTTHLGENQDTLICGFCAK